MIKGNASRLVPTCLMVEEHEMETGGFLKPVTGPQQIDRKIIYISLLIVVFLGIFCHFTAGEIFSSATVVLMVFIVLGNVGYVYSRAKRRSNRS